MGAETAGKLEWTKRAEGFFYTTSPDDVGRGLKVVCTPRGGSGKVDTDPVETGSFVP